MPSLKSVPTRIARSTSAFAIDTPAFEQATRARSSPGRSAGTCPGWAEIPCRRWSGSAPAGARRRAANRSLCSRPPRSAARSRPCARPAPRPRTAPAPSARPSAATARAPRPPSLASGARSSSLSSRRWRRRRAPARRHAPPRSVAVPARRFAISRALSGGGSPSNTNVSRSAVVGHETRAAVEQAGEVRRRAPFRIAQRRAVAQPDQREELVELAVAVNRERPAAQRVERDGVFRDDRSKDDAHVAMTFESRPGA